MNKFREWVIRFCWECLYIVALIATYSVLAVAQPRSLNADMDYLRDNHLGAVLGLSLLGGIVGLLSRMQDPKWRANASTSGLLITIISELSFSVFTGLLLLYVGIHQQWDGYLVVISILVGSWLGTKAARIILLWIKGRSDVLLKGDRDERI